MKKQRKTITLSLDMLGIADSLEGADKLIFYETIIDHFLKGHDIEQDKLPGMVRVAVAGAVPQIRRLQAIYQNGLQKKSIQNTKAALCPSKISKTKQTEAIKSNDGQADESYIYNNIYNKNISFNKQTNNISNKQTNIPAVEINTEETLFYLDCLKTQMEKIQPLLSPDIYKTTLNLFNKIAEEPGFLKINAVEKPPAFFLENYLNIFRSFDVQVPVDKLTNAYMAMENGQSKIKNKYKYFASTLLNISQGL